MRDRAAPEKRPRQRHLQAATAERLVREQFAIIETGQLELAAGNVTADFVNHRAPPTGRSFAARQVHWFRIVDDAIAEHDAVRDDLAMAAHVGWFPPRPSYVVRMLLARRRYRRPPTPET